MTESPASATPYEVLGVSAADSQDALRRAYRRLARETHPDLGGSPERFRQVQLAWEAVGTVEDRAAYDRGRSRDTSSAGSSSGSSRSPHSDQSRGAGWGPAPSRPRSDSKPRARSYGHPGGQERVRFLDLMREWVGRGEEVDDPYDAALVRSAPVEIRRILAQAIAEEETAKIVSELGIAYTIWNNVATERDDELDHIVLGPTGLYAVDSGDWGGPVEVAGGELAGQGIADGEQPARALARSARAFKKLSRVGFTAELLVVPDDSLADPVQAVGTGRRNSMYVVRRSVLGHVLRGGLTGGLTANPVDVFEIRDRIQQTARCV